MVIYVYDYKNKLLKKRGITHILKGEELLNNFDVMFYYKNNGECPFLSFLESLDIKMRARVLRMVMLLEQNGNELREPYSKSLGDGLFELRIIQGNNISRVFYFFIVGRKVIITNGFVKKTEKTPPREIALAKKYRNDYLSRKEIQE